MKIEFDTENFAEKAKRKAWEVKHDLEIKTNEAINWGMEHKELVIAASPFVYSGAKKLYKLLAKTKAQRFAEKQESRFWDYRTGRHVYPKRKLTSEEEDYVERLYRNNKDLTYREILKEINAL